MRPIIFLLFFLLLFSCKQDNKVSYRLMNIGDISYQNAIKENKIEKVYFYRKRKTKLFFEKDTFGEIAFNVEGNPIKSSYGYVMGYDDIFEYYNQNLPSKKEHRTDAYFKYDYKYNLGANSNKVYQYWIIKPLDQPEFIIDTFWYEFNRSGQLNKSRTNIKRMLNNRIKYFSEYNYNTIGLLQTRIDNIDTTYHNFYFRPYSQIPTRIVTHYYYSNNSIDSTIEVYNIREDATNYTETEVTYYQNMLPIKTILNDTIVTSYFYKKRKKN